MISSIRKPRGFSLLEVLVAVTILSLGFMSLASLQSALIRSASDSKAMTLAMGVAKQKIEHLAAVQSLGGSDNACVSPSFWVAGQTSCYRAITDESAADYDGDPILTGTQPLGGIEFRVATTVTRFVFNANTSLFASANDTALDSALLTTAPETFLPGKEFKRVVVTVTWEDAGGNTRRVEVEDALTGIVPRDSIALLINRRGTVMRKAESIIFDPGRVAGVIPVAIGNESATAASNPTPEILGSRTNTYVAETRFNVYSYQALGAGTALAQSRLETAVVGCRCDTGEADNTEQPLRPSYWNGLIYVRPTIASYAAPAGPKRVTGSELPQSAQCRTCCRDHHDPEGNDLNGIPNSAVARFSPRRSSHSHYLVNATTGARSPVTTGVYSEVCRLIRVDGIFRVTPDMNNDHFALLPAGNAGASSFAPTAETSANYADLVKKYLAARIGDETDNTRYNDSRNAPTPAGPVPASFELGTRTLADGVTSRDYDLNAPASYFLMKTNDSRWLHARGLYLDYLGPEAIARIDAAKTACPDDKPAIECVLPYLPFTSINLSEIAEWKDAPINPSSTATGQVLSVMNNGFRTATGDDTFVTTGATGAAGTKTVNFSTTLPTGVVVGMAISGTGIADGARVTAVSGGAVSVDKSNVATVAGPVVFQGAPVRGLASSGGAPALGNAAFARATASYNNAAVAIRFPSHPDEGVLTDAQRFEITATGSSPDPTSGSFTVTGFTDGSGALYPFGTPYPVIEWGRDSSGAFDINPCTREGAPLPYLCFATSGLGGPMRIRLSGYNVRLTKSESFTGSCTKPDGTMVTTTGTTIRPYCRNYDVLSASTAITAASGASPYSVVNAGKATESTELLFPVLNKNDVITLGLGQNGEAAGTFVSCTATKQGGLSSVAWSDPCL